ncbi:MAG TPA: hypothetical protein P5270_04755 [Victivallales bacterium]|nr:hypothetical protein [Victivallales bacterium]HRR28652.1 hypothetical protein [Victivallales bacterium]
MKKKTVFFAILYCCSLALYSSENFRLKIKADKNITVYLNGFYFDNKSKTACDEYLINGKNSIVIEPANKTTVDIKIEKCGEGVDTIFSFKGEIFENTTKEFDLNISSRWYWQDGDNIESISDEDRKTIIEATNNVIEAYKTGDFVSVIDTTMKAYIENYAKMKNKPSNEIRTSWLSSYKELLGPEVRVSFEVGEGELDIELSRYNKKIVRVFRKNGNFLTRIVLEIGDSKEYQYFFMKKDGKWLMQ